MKRVFSGMGLVRIFMAIALLLFPIVVNAKNIQVIKEGGKKAFRAGKTKIVFKTPNDQTVGIYELMGESTGFATGPGGTATAYGVDLRPICDAPAELKLENGSYNFRVSDNAMLGAKFKIDAEGGTQYWEVKNVNPGEAIGGITLFTLSSITTLVAFIIFAVGNTTYDANDNPVSSHDTGMLALGLVGTGAAVGSYFLIDDGVAHAKLIDVKF